jgi:tetratricopeptide (TPR) repeat protein
VNRYRDDFLKAAKDGDVPEGEQRLDRQTAEFYTIRMLLSWKQKNLALATYMFNKATGDVPSPAALEPQAAEYMAKALFEIGSGLYKEKAYPTAVEWLQRAFDILSKVDALYLSELGSEIRLNATHNLARACIKSGTAEHLEKARNIIDLMAEEWPSRLATSLLELELVQAQNAGDFNAYHRILLRVIDTTQLSEQTFKIIMGKIHLLVTKKATGPVKECLDALIHKRLLPMDREDWLARAFVTRLWATIQDQDCREEVTIQKLYELLDAIAKHLEKPLSPTATYAAQSLLWKVSETFYLREKYQLASAWCRVALHMVFDKAGELNLAKISR